MSSGFQIPSLIASCGADVEAPGACCERYESLETIYEEYDLKRAAIVRNFDNVWIVARLGYDPCFETTFCFNDKGNQISGIYFYLRAERASLLVG